MPQQAVDSNINELLSSLNIATGTLRESLNTAQLKKHVNFPHGIKTKKEIISVLMHEVERRYGIAPGDMVERKLVRIFEAMDFNYLERWSQSLLSSNAIETEWLSLVECLTVHETYFDRDKEQLGTLFNDILPSMIEQKHLSGDYRLRIWSAGCSSGEETYNLAMLALMVMKNAGFALEQRDGSILPIPSWSISVLGSDISSQMIRTAKNATYTTGKMGSFRNMNPMLWRFFDELPDEEAGASREKNMRVKKCVSSITSFYRHNLLEPLVDSPLFDLIVCRNVLIYFNNSKKVVLKQLADSLKTGGVLMLGATDVMQSRYGLKQCQHKGVFWHEKI